MFDVQMFGSNDTLTADNSLTLVFMNNLEQTKTFSVKAPNPKSTIDETAIKNVMTYMLNNSIFYDPKTESVVTGVWVNKTAYKTEKTIRTLDLTPEL